MKHFLLTALLLSGATLAQTSTPATPTTTATAAAQDPAATVAQVGKETFTVADFNRAFQLAVARVVNAQGIPYDDTYLTEFEGVRADFLKQYVRDRAVYQLARVNNAPDATVIDEQMKGARADFATDAEFSDALKATGYASPDELRAELERQAVVGAYLAAVQKRFTFGDAVVAGYYSANRAKFTQEAQACVKHILVPTQAEAQAIAKELAGGGNFAAIATAKSQDPGSAAQGGDLGCFAPGEMVDTFDKASFTGPLNTVQVVQSQFGWHVLMVTKRTVAGLMPLAEAAPLIRDQLSRDAAQKYVDAQVAKLNTVSFPAVITVTPAQK